MSYKSYPVEDWQYEVVNGDTRLGYVDWRDAKIEADKTHYVVSWEVDVWAASPREAAAEARRIHNESNPQIPDSATVYLVTPKGGLTTFTVDLGPDGDKDAQK